MQLAEHYGAGLVSEYSRNYLTHLGRPYEEKDLLDIARGQMGLEAAAKINNTSMIICDTSLLVIKVWSLYKYNRCHPWILDQLKHRENQLYLLTHHDIPYEEDPLRENPHDRHLLFGLYKSALESQDTPYVIVQGDKKSRLDIATRAIDKLAGM